MLAGRSKLQLYRQISATRPTQTNRISIKNSLCPGTVKLLFLNWPAQIENPVPVTQLYSRLPVDDYFGR